MARRGTRGEYRIVLIGKTGAGKSATGNSLLDNANAFESRNSAKSVTQTCTKAQGVYGERDVIVVDTPGLFDLSKEDVKKDIMNCVSLLLPGPHIFVLVVEIDRITDEVQKAVDIFAKYFGTDIYTFMIVVFTRRDEVQNDAKFNEYVTGIHGNLGKTLQKINFRYIGFDNKNKSGRLPEQVERFYAMVHQLFHMNHCTHYTNKMLRDADKMVAKEKAVGNEAREINERREREDAEHDCRATFINQEMHEIEEAFDQLLRKAGRKGVKNRRGLFEKLKNLFQ